MTKDPATFPLPSPPESRYIAPMWQTLLRHTRQQQEQLDAQIAAWQNGYRQTGGTSYCGKGCSACCTLAVNCSFPEALSIALDLDASLWEEISRHAGCLWQTAESSGSLREYLQRKRLLGPCPFLDHGGACRIHPSRPLSCRALISTRESRWCGTDFSALSSEEKQLFMAGLDRRVADFPLHYAALPRAWGAEREHHLLQRMAEQFGFALTGALPYLLWLEREHALSSHIADGFESSRSRLEQRRLLHPFLTNLVCFNT